MKPEINKQESDWLNQAEELDDTEAAELNGGSSIGDSLSALAEKLSAATGTGKASTSTSDNSVSSRLAEVLKKLT